MASQARAVVGENQGVVVSMASKWIVLGQLCVRGEDILSFQRTSEKELLVQVCLAVPLTWHREADPDGELFAELLRALEAV